MAKVWKVPNVEVCRLPIPQTPYIPNNQFFSLYKKSGKNTYRRVSLNAYSSGRIAGKVWADVVGSDPMKYSIRICKLDDNKAEGSGSRFPRVGGKDNMRIHRER